MSKITFYRNSLDIEWNNGIIDQGSLFVQTHEPDILQLVDDDVFFVINIDESLFNQVPTPKELIK